MNGLHRLLLGCVFCACLASAGNVPAQAVLCASGRYAIVVTQEVPNVLRQAEPLVLEECLRSETIRDGSAFRLRRDYPISGCSVSNVHFDGAFLTYRIVCPQANGPRASAKFIATPSGYEGTITVNMGMTIIERHSARRVGECDGKSPPGVLDEEYFRRAWPPPKLD